MNSEDLKKIEDLLIPSDDLEKMNFAQLSLYIEELNKLEKDIDNIDEKENG